MFVYIVYVLVKDVVDVIMCVCSEGLCVFGEVLLGYLVIDEVVYCDLDWMCVVVYVMSLLFCLVEYCEVLWCGL